MLGGPRQCGSMPSSPNTSVLDLTWDDEEARSVSKKVATGETVPSQDKEYSEANEALASKVRRVIKEIDKEVRVVAEAARERNTKKGIKEAAIALRSMLSTLMSEEVQTLLQTLGKSRTPWRDIDEHTYEVKKMADRLETVEGRVEEVVEANRILREENARLREKLARAPQDTGGEEVAARLEKVEKELGDLRKSNKVLKEENARLRSEAKSLKGVTGEELSGVASFIDYQALQRRSWEDRTFQKAFMIRGTPHDGNKDTDLVYIADEEDSPPDKVALRHTFTNRYPELANMEGRLSVLSNITRTVDREGVIHERERLIFSVEAGLTASDWFDTLLKVRKEVQEKGRRKISFYPPDRDPNGIETRKMLECIFRNTETKCLIHVKGQMPTKNKKRTIPAKKRETEALMVSQTEGQYADLLRTVKDRVRPESAAATAIKTIRKSREGGMVIIIDTKNKEAKDALVNEVKKVQGVKTRLAGRISNKAAVYLRGIDAITTREDVTQAIGEIELLKNVQYDVSELRPSLGCNQMATITLEEDKAEVLARMGEIRIGLSWCSLEKRINVVQCFKCWGYGHVRASCTDNIDGRDACKKCGRGGHIAEGCKDVERCLTCKVEGHRADSGRCPEFRKALSRARLRARKQKAY